MIAGFGTDAPSAKEKDSSTTTVVNKKNSQFDVYIGRGSVFGNPFIIGVHGSREDVIRKYEEWVRQQPHILALLPTLRGKRLGCFCKPLACHGDVLVKLIEESYTLYGR
jgi:hypothetical protein